MLINKPYDIITRIAAVVLTYLTSMGAYSYFDAFYVTTDHPLYAMLSILLFWELHRICFLKAYKYLLPEATMGARIAVVFTISYTLCFILRFYNFYTEAWLYHLPYPNLNSFLIGNAFICLMAIWPFIATFEILYVNRVVLQVEEEKEQLMQANMQRQYDSLREQVNPHFLFNNLNSLSTLISKDAEKAEEFVEQMSSVYRYLLTNNNENTTLLSEELKFIDSYNHLLKTRFAKGYDPEINIPENLAQLKIPPMTLQLLVENAIKHNAVSAEHPLRLRIYTENEKLIVQNNLQPKLTAIHSAGVGLANIIAKYSLLNQPPVQVTKTATDFTVVLPLIK